MEVSARGLSSNRFQRHKETILLLDLRLLFTEVQKRKGSCSDDRQEGPTGDPSEG